MKKMPKKEANSSSCQHFDTHMGFILPDLFIFRTPEHPNTQSTFCSSLPSCRKRYIDCEVIYQQRVRGFYQGFQTPRNRWKQEAASAECFYCFEVFGMPDETEAQVFEMASQTSVKISWNFFRRIGHQKVWSTGNCSFFIHMVNEWIFNIHFLHEAMCIGEY